MFTLILSKVLFLYLVGLVGFALARLNDISLPTVSLLLVYVIVPAVSFYGVYLSDFEFSSLFLTFISFLCCVFLSAAYKFVLSGLNFSRGDVAVLSFSSGTGNTGYFGIPLALALFGQNNLSEIVLIVLGFQLYEATFGYFIMAQGAYSAKTAFFKLIKLPLFYAASLGLLFNYLAIDLKSISWLFENFIGANAIVGMLLLGFSAASLRPVRVTTKKFIFCSLLSKFFLWPLLAILLITIDANYFHLYDSNIYSIFWVMSLVPIAANTIAFANVLGVDHERATTTLILSTVVAIPVMPLGLYLLASLI